MTWYGRLHSGYNTSMPHFLPATPGARARLFGLLAAAAAIGVGVYINRSLPQSGYQFLFLAAGLAAFICASLLWWLLPERRKRNLLVWGILAGALTGLVSHYLAWYLMFVGANICFWLSGGCTSSLGEPPASFQDGLWGAAALTMFSLVFVGWMTIMLGGAVGGVYAFLVRLQASRGEYPGEFNE